MLSPGSPPKGAGIAVPMTGGYASEPTYPRLGVAVPLQSPFSESSCGGVSPAPSWGDGRAGIVCHDFVFQFLGEQRHLWWPDCHLDHAGSARAASRPCISLSMRQCSLLTLRAAYFWISGMPVISLRHITDALHIPAASLADRCAELEKFRDKPIVVGKWAGPGCHQDAARSFGRSQSWRRHDGVMRKTAGGDLVSEVMIYTTAGALFAFGKGFA